MFRKFASRLAAALSLAKPAEIQKISDGLDESLRGTNFDKAIVEDAPVQQRAPRYRLRDRNTAFSRRQPAVTPRELHEQANNKGFQFIYNPLLTGLLYKAGVFEAKA